MNKSGAACREPSGIQIKRNEGRMSFNLAFGVNSTEIVIVLWLKAQGEKATKCGERAGVTLRPTEIYTPEVKRNSEAPPPLWAHSEPLGIRGIQLPAFSLETRSSLTSLGANSRRHKVYTTAGGGEYLAAAFPAASPLARARPPAEP